MGGSVPDQDGSSTSECELCHETVVSDMREEVGKCDESEPSSSLPSWYSYIRVNWFHMTAREPNV